MKKSGFTLAEILLSLAIIGIIAAVTIPSLLNLRPDTAKMKVIKCKNVLEKLNAELLDDSSIYAVNEECSGLDCTEPADETAYNDVSGGNKYINLVARNLETDTKYAKGTSTTLSDNSTITTRDGIKWRFNNRTVILSIDPNKSESDSCMYPDCDKPNKFRLKVNNDGSVSGDDPMSKAYFDNSQKFNDRKTDLKNAKTYSGN